MGVALTELLLTKEIELSSLQNKTLVVDTPMWLYQFLSSIRQRDGSLLMDSHGNVTSHLMGLISRISNLSQLNIKLAFVFDGEPHKLKHLTLEKRKQIKLDAQKKFESAKEKSDLEMMKKYAMRTSRLTKDMVSDAKNLVKAFGLPVIEAPSEAEAQASRIVKDGHAYGLCTNDADALLFGSPRVIRNLNMAGKKKKVNKLSYQTINPDILNLEDNLKHLGISHDQLIALAMLIGTDFNSGGVKGVGPKNALKIVKNHGENFDVLFKEVKWHDFFEFGWKEVFDVIKGMPTNAYELAWSKVNEDDVMKLLRDKHDFSEERVTGYIENIQKTQQHKKQKGLGDFF